MKKLSLLLISITTLLLTNNNLLAQAGTFTVAPFNKIFINGNINANYNYLDTTSSTIMTDNQIDIKVENGILMLQSKAPAKVLIKSNQKNIREISCKSVSHLNFKNPLVTDTIIIQTQDVAKVKAEVKSSKIIIKQQDVSNIQLTGATEQLVAQIKDVSKLNTKDLHAKSVIIDMKDVSAANVFAENSITADVYDQSSLKLEGTPTNVAIEKHDITAKVKKNDAKFPADDTTAMNNKNKKSWKYKYGSNNTSFHGWQGLALGVNGYLTSGGSFALPQSQNYMSLNYPKSINFQLNLLQHNFYLYKKYIALATGFGIEWRRFAFDNNTKLNPDTNYTYGLIDNTKQYQYKLNIFKSTLLQVPLLFEFNTNSNPNKSFHFDIGVVGQLLVNSKTKQELAKDGYTYEITRNDGYNLNPFQFKAHFSMGYSHLMAYSEYTFNSLFKSGQGPQLYPFTVGIRWCLFN